MTIRRLLVWSAAAAAGSLFVLPGPAVGANAAPARTLLGPDLALTAVSAPVQVLTGRAFTVDATVAELNGDAGASATVTASANGAVLATAPVVVPAGGSVVATLSATLPAAGPTRIDVAITAADPAETSLGNNIRSATIDVTDFQVVPSTAVGPSLAGYGGQFNENVYATISRAAGVSDDNLKWMEQSVLGLRPEFSRIFFAQAAFNDPDMMASFVRTVLLAQRTGTTINVTWQGGTLDVKSGTVQKFAEVLVNLVVKSHVTNLRWVTLQNEPNSTKITLAQYEAQYRELDPYIANIRGQVRFMGGDLVQTNQRAWFAYLGANMTDILDAYSIHVFWDYWDVQKLQDRLTEVRAIVDGMPEAQRKPLYVTEYGVRGLRTFNGAASGDPGVWVDGTPITETNVSAFEHAWFDILSSRLGYAGTSKWDTYFGRYDKGVQAYYMIGSPDRGWPKHPMYNLVLPDDRHGQARLARRRARRGAGHDAPRHRLHRRLGLDARRSRHGRRAAERSLDGRGAVQHRRPAALQRVPARGVERLRRRPRRPRHDGDDGRGRNRDLHGAPAGSLHADHENRRGHAEEHASDARLTARRVREPRAPAPSGAHCDFTYSM